MRAGRNRIGAVSLAIAAGGFLAVLFQPWIPLDRLPIVGPLSLEGLLLALFEAALVGAVADWFAVTALFRNPLGIPLPHTDILARKKDTVAEAVPRFLTSFMNDERIASELFRLDFAAKLDEAFSREGVRETFHDFLRLRLAGFLSKAGSAPQAAELPGGRPGGAPGIVADLCAFAAEKLDLASAFASLLRWTRREGFDDRLIGAGSELLRTEMGKNRFRIAAAITPLVRRNAGWQGLFIGKGTIEGLLRGIEDELAELRSDRRHELRLYLSGALETYAARLAGELSDSSGARGRFADAARGILADEGFRSGLSDFVTGILRDLGSDLASPDSRFIEAMGRLEDGVLAQVRGDPAFRERFNLGVAGIASGIVVRSHLVEALTGYIISMLKDTDPRYFVQRVEDAVWNDLQYIRVNGAVVGGLVGMLLALFTAALRR